MWKDGIAVWKGWLEKPIQMSLNFQKGVSLKVSLAQLAAGAANTTEKSSKGREWLPNLRIDLHLT